MRKQEPNKARHRTAEAEKIAADIATVMFRHGLDFKLLNTFLLANTTLLEAGLAKKKRHRQYLEERAKIRRELLRRHVNGETYRQIAETLDINLTRASETKATEVDRIWKAICADPNSVPALAEEYGLSTYDIMTIYQKRQDRYDAQVEEDRLWAEQCDDKY